MGDVKFLSNWVGLESVPESYVFPPEMRASIVVKKSIPVVDFATLDRAFLVQKILDASQEFGFFQMINHGVPKMLLEETMRIFREFHGMSTPDKLRECSRDPKSCRVYTSNDAYMTEQIHSWRDYIRFNCYPLEKYVHFWPQNPPKYSGLQFLKDGEWLVVDPIDGSLLVNIGYVLQVISNGKLKAVEHRAVTNGETSRQSIVYLVHPKDDATIEPAKCMINEVDPPRYRSRKHEDFERYYLSMNADSEAVMRYLSSNYQP